MKHHSHVILLSSLFLIVSCSSANQPGNGINPYSNVRMYNAGLEQITRLTVRALRDQGFGIDNGSSSTDKNAYVILAHLNNEYVAGASNTGYTNNPSETELKVTVSYISEMKTKVEIQSEENTSGVRNSYRKDINRKIFHYIDQHL